MGPQGCPAAAMPPEAIDTRESLLRADQDNDEALETFLRDNSERAYHVAHAALWDREAALDAVQESMAKLVEYYRNRPAGEWPALFRTVLKSKINDLRRRRMIEQGKLRLISLTGLFNRVDTEASEYDVPSPERPDCVTAPEVEVVSGQLREKIEAALLGLSDRQRQVFVLREWRGLSTRETAVVLGCSENSVKQHHFRALRELRKQLAEVWHHA